MCADAIALMPLVTPGPAVSAQTPGSRVTFAQPSAANAAADSWRTSIRSMPSARQPSYMENRWPPESVNSLVDAVRLQPARDQQPAVRLLCLCCPLHVRGVRASGPSSPSSLPVGRNEPYPGLRWAGRGSRRLLTALGAVLAGGRSTRLGRPKASALLGGRRPDRASARRASRGADSRRSWWQSATRRCRALDVPVWVEPDEPAHPLLGIATALARCGAAGPRLRLRHAVRDRSGSPQRLAAMDAAARRAEHGGPAAPAVRALRPALLEPLGEALERALAAAGDGRCARARGAGRAGAARVRRPGAAALQREHARRPRRAEEMLR